MNYLRDALIGTNDYHNVLTHFGIEGLKREAGYIPTIETKEDDKVTVETWHVQDRMSYFVSFLPTAKIAIYTDMCTGCMKKNQRFIDNFYGEKLPYIFLASYTPNCGHTGIPNVAMGYFVNNKPKMKAPNVPTWSQW